MRLKWRLHLLRHLHPSLRPLRQLRRHRSSQRHRPHRRVLQSPLCRGRNCKPNCCERPRKRVCLRWKKRVVATNRPASRIVMKSVAAPKIIVVLKKKPQKPPGFRRKKRPVRRHLLKSVQLMRLPPQRRHRPLLKTMTAVRPGVMAMRLHPVGSLNARTAIVAGMIVANMAS